MTVALTGGSGVVGAAVVRHLVDAGERVRAVVRSDSSAGKVKALGAEPVLGDVASHDDLVSAFAGCEVVYHAAGINELCSARQRQMYEVNVAGTRRVLRACNAAGVRRLVHTSSAVTIGERAGQVATEQTVHRGWYLSDYERSKHHAEMVAFGERTDVEVVAVNPSSVQGPGRATGTGKIILDMLSGRLPAMVEAWVSMVDIDDCARGHLLAAREGQPGHRYLLSGFTTTVSTAMVMAAETLGRSVNTPMVPLWMVRTGVTVAEMAGRLVGWRPPVCSEMIRVMAHGHRYDGSEATRRLGLAYTPAADTLARMVEWFQAEGLLQ